MLSREGLESTMTQDAEPGIATLQGERKRTTRPRLTMHHDGSHVLQQLSGAVVRGVRRQDVGQRPSREVVLPAVEVTHCDKVRHLGRLHALKHEAWARN